MSLPGSGLCRPGRLSNPLVAALCCIERQKNPKAMALPGRVRWTSRHSIERYRSRKDAERPPTRSSVKTLGNTSYRRQTTTSTGADVRATLPQGTGLFKVEIRLRRRAKKARIPSGQVKGD